MSTREDAELLARLLELWSGADPVPAGMIDRLVAAVAADGLDRDYALLPLVHGKLGGVRSLTEALTLQFSDGSTSILLHVTQTTSGRRRVDGWVDTVTAEIALTQGDRTQTTSPKATGRFVFDDVPPVLTHVRLTTMAGDGIRTLSTPPFEL